jgi:hypothetical protein
LTDEVHALDERLEIGGKALGANLDLDLPAVGERLVLVDRIPHLAQLVAQLHLALALHRELDDRNRHGRKDRDHRADDGELDHREAARGVAPARPPGRLQWTTRVAEDVEPGA